MTDKKLSIDWIGLAQQNIELKYICPICIYESHSHELVKEHIYLKHTNKEIMEVCS